MTWTSLPARNEHGNVDSSGARGRSIFPVFLSGFAVLFALPFAFPTTSYFVESIRVLRRSGQVRLGQAKPPVTSRLLIKTDEGVGLVFGRVVRECRETLTPTPTPSSVLLVGQSLASG